MLFDLQNNGPLEDTVPYMRFSELEHRICQAALLQATKREAMFKIFEEASDEISSEHFNILRRLGEDGSRSFRDWLGYFEPMRLH